jgi:hypothetical protein
LIPKKTNRSLFEWERFFRRIFEMLKLSKKWASVLLSQPETGMSYQIASIFLRDGKRFDQVTIVGDIISEINGNKEILFIEDEITDIKVTHGK